MSERSRNWTACAIGIGLFGAMLGGCRTHPAPVVSAVAEPTPTAVVAESAAEDGPHPQGEPEDGSKAAIAENLQKGETEESRGRPAQAAEYYERILHIEARHAEAHRRLARIAAAGQDYRQAERHLRVALEAYPDSRELWTSLARCCAAQNRPRDARRALQRAVGSKNPGIPVAGSFAEQPVFATRDERPGRIHLAPLPPRLEGTGQPPTMIVRTARATSEHPRRTSVDNPQRHALPLLPKSFVRQARARPRDASSEAIHLVSLTPDEMIREDAGSIPSQDSQTTVPDGNLPLWEGGGSLRMED